MGTVRNWTPLDKFRDGIMYDKLLDDAGYLYLNTPYFKNMVDFEQYYNTIFNHEEVYKAQRK